MPDSPLEQVPAPWDELTHFKPELTWKLVQGTLWHTWRHTMRLRIYGAERIPASGPIVLACNHQSNVDSFALGLAVRPRTIRYLAKTELFNTPLIGHFVRHTGSVPIRRGEADRDAIRMARRVISEGKLLGVFVEGTRHKEIGDVQPGAAMLAIGSGAPIIVCCISGSRRHAKNPRHPVSVSFSTPIDVSTFGRGSKAYRAASGVLKLNLERQFAFLQEMERAGRPRQGTPPEAILELDAADG